MLIFRISKIHFIYLHLFTFININNNTSIIYVYNLINIKYYRNII